MKTAWLAIASTRSWLAYVVDTPENELHSWRNWSKRRGQKILGEFPTQRQAQQHIAIWLEMNPVIYDFAPFPPS
jgi:hypothetical protein